MQREKPMAVGNPLPEFRVASQRDRPMAVGGIGMITTANYAARRHAACFPPPRCCTSALVLAILHGVCLFQEPLAVQVSLFVCHVLRKRQYAPFIVCVKWPCCLDRYGVRSAMPGFIGRRLCPELVFVSCNFEKYSAARC